MTPAYEAVVLAAGRGSRLGELTRERPKALLPIGPRSQSDSGETSFLRRQCELLAAAKVQRIVVVIGYCGAQVRAAVSSWDLPQVQIVENTTADIGTSGSLHSVQFAVRGAGVLDGQRQTLIMDADIVYHKAALARLLDAPARTSLLVSTSYTAGDEEVLVWGSLEAPRFLGKGLSTQLTGTTCLGEATGIIKIAPDDHALSRALIDWMVGDPSGPGARRAGFAPARQATEHEELTQHLMRLGRARCVACGAELPFMEVDSPREYATVRETLYPRLLELEART